MLPDDCLSSTPVPSNFLGARGLPISATVDYEDGGIALQDASEGLFYQRWKGYIKNNNVYLSAPEVSPTIIHSDTGISEISFTFDQNMNYVLAFVKDGASYLKWYDSSLESIVVTAIGSGVTTPRVTLDDKRLRQNDNNDVILAYVKNSNLYYAQQRDRFTVERLLYEGVSGGLVKIGMGVNNRLHFMLRYS